MIVAVRWDASFHPSRQGSFIVSVSVDGSNEWAVLSTLRVASGRCHCHEQSILVCGGETHVMSMNKALINSNQLGMAASWLHCQDIPCQLGPWRINDRATETVLTNTTRQVVETDDGVAPMLL